MVSLVVAVVMQGHARPRGGDVGAILGMYRKSAVYYSKGDVKGVMSLLASDFKGTNLKGKVNEYKDMEKETAGFFETCKHIRLNWKITRIRVQLPNASNLADYVMTCQSYDRGGKVHNVRILGRENHTWRKEVGGWKQTSGKAVSEQVFVDGKPVK